MTKSTTPRLNEEAKRILDSHLKVGPKKPISYLPSRTVEKVIGITIPAYIAMIENLGNKAIAFSAKECCINSGAVYAYSPTDLDNVLKGHQGILVEHGWPIVPIDFIRRLAAEWLDEGSPIMPTVRRAFGERSRSS